MSSWDDIPKRTVAAAPKGTRQLLGREVVCNPAQGSISLANWQSGRQGGMPCTLYVYRAFVGNNPDANLPWEYSLEISMRKLGAQWREVIPFPSVGVVRRMIADEVTVSVVPNPDNFGVSPLTHAANNRTLGAACVDGFAPTDRVSALIEDADDFPETTLIQPFYFPIGAKHFRIWNAEMAGSVRFANLGSTAGANNVLTPQPQGVTGIPIIQFANWTPVPANASALLYTVDNTSTGAQTATVEVEL